MKVAAKKTAVKKPQKKSANAPAVAPLPALQRQPGDRPVSNTQYDAESCILAGRESTCRVNLIPVAGTVLPMMGPLLIRSFDSRRKITRVEAPILFIHGSGDHTVPMALGRALFDAAPEPKSFWAIPGAGHNDIVESAGPEYRKRLRSFYESLPDRAPE